MKILKGKSISGTGMWGMLHKGQEVTVDKEAAAIRNAEAEIERFRKAWEQTAKQLEVLYQRVVQQAGEHDAEVFAAHKILLEDEIFTTNVENNIRQKGVGAQEALKRAKEAGIQQLLAVKDAYIRSRTVDLEDVAEGLLACLQEKTQGMDEEVTGILWVEALTPSRVMQLDRTLVGGVVTGVCSAYSHAAILARTLGIPVFVCEDLVAEEQKDGKFVVVEDDTLYLEPEEEIRKELEAKRGTAFDGTYSGEGAEPLETKAKLPFRLMANLGRLEDAPAAKAMGAEGVGLFRSECIFLERDSLPTEEEQFRIYKALVEEFAGRMVTIRTLDIGSDKQCSYFPQEKEENPALGLRGIRLCLENRTMFKTQLRALLRAAAYGKLRILYPMISSVEELREINGLLKEVQAELTGEGLAYALPKQGILIETPAAVLISDLLAREAGFFSVGTNDLVQYALAADRQNVKMEKYYNPYHPVVERMLELVVKNAHQAGITVSVCGELSGDEQMTEMFLRLGVDELSLSPMQIPKIRRRVFALEKIWR